MRRWLFFGAVGAAAVGVDRVFLARMPPAIEGFLLMVVIGFFLGLVGPMVEGTGRFLLSDVGFETGRGALLGFALAIALTVARAAFHWAPGPLLPALIWPLVALWPGPGQG